MELGAHRRGRLARSALVASGFALAAALAATPARAGIGAGVGNAGINIVRLAGVLGEKGVPDEIMGLILIADGRDIHFSVTSARRISPSPEEGIGVLIGMGPGTPRVVLAGEPAFLKPIAAAPAGTEVTIIGNLTVGMRYLELLGVDLPPLTGSQ